jgi:hypothetical protein
VGYPRIFRYPRETKGPFERSCLFSISVDQSGDVDLNIDPFWRGNQARRQEAPEPFPKTKKLGELTELIGSHLLL